LLISLLGGVVRLDHFARLAEIEEGLVAEASAIRRLAALAVWVEEDAERLAARLRLSNAEAGRLTAMADRRPEQSPGMTEIDRKEALYRLGRRTFEDRVLIGWARSGADAANEDWRRLYRLPDRWTPPALPVKGQDLLARGIPSGPRLGSMLKELEAKWIASDFTLGKDELLRDCR
jgi:poly(A) polymerase